MSATETNIQVVVRCRPRSDKELKDNSPSIVNFNSIKSKEINIRSILSDRNLTRSYTFDKVFSPEASQELVYREVVAPILEEVLTGYNCTIFAYGQTGTGKT
ncbi:kinesin motor protein cin8, partial [Coelomomyces lativittatus]